MYPVHKGRPGQASALYLLVSVSGEGLVGRVPVPTISPAWCMGASSCLLPPVPQHLLSPLSGGQRTRPLFPHEHLLLGSWDLPVLENCLPSLPPFPIFHLKKKKKSLPRANMRQSHCSTPCWKCLQTVHPPGEMPGARPSGFSAESRDLGGGSRRKGRSRDHMVLFRPLADLRLSTPAAWGSISGEDPRRVFCFAKSRGGRSCQGTNPLSVGLWGFSPGGVGGWGFQPKAQERCSQAHPQRESLWRSAHQMHLPPSAAQPRTVPMALAPVRTSDIICRTGTE